MWRTSKFLVKNVSWNFHAHRMLSELKQSKPPLVIKDAAYALKLNRDLMKLKRNKRSSNFFFLRSKLTQEEMLKIAQTLTDAIERRKLQFYAKIKERKIDEKLKTLTSQSEVFQKFLTPENLNRMAIETSQKWTQIQATDGYKNFKKLPRKSFEVSKTTAKEIQRYLIIFYRSKFNKNLMKASKFVIACGLKVTFEVFKFFIDVIKAPVKLPKH
jgi:hypothetical protein